MFHILSKTIGVFISPIGIILTTGFFVYYYRSKNHTKFRVAMLICILLTYSLFCPALINMWAKAWESPQKSIKTTPAHEIGVLLTGGLMNPHTAHPENMVFADHSDRLWQALHLFKEGKIKEILITGGDISLTPNRRTKVVDLCKAYLIYNGVPATHILIEGKAKNTFQNALYTKEMLEKEGKMDSQLLLITSAFHMRRAQACFEHQDLTFGTFPTDYISFSGPYVFEDFLPSVKSFYLAKLLMKEQLGYIIYHVMGYI